jgi:Domain of unknown function (DUF1905)
VELEFEGEVFHWRGPSPYYFVAVPDPMCDDLRVAARDVSYGWGVIPVTVRIGATTWTTSLFPKDGGYLVSPQGPRPSRRGDRPGRRCGGAPDGLTLVGPAR